MEGGRPSRGLATDPDSPALHTQPTRLPPAGATPRHHQEEQEEMFLVPLSASGLEETNKKDIFDTMMHCAPFFKNLQMMNYGDVE